MEVLSASVDMSLILAKLKQRQTELGMTNQQVSDASGVPYSSFTRSPSFQDIAAIAAALDLSLDDLTGRGRTPAAAAPPDDRFLNLVFRQHHLHMAEKNRWIKILFAVVTLLVCFIIVILLIDITNPAVGWFRYQQAHGSGSLFASSISCPRPLS